MANGIELETGETPPTASRDVEQSVDRAPRDIFTRNESFRGYDSFMPQRILPDPNPREGWSHRWVRVAVNNEVDNKNLSRRLNEGYVACHINDYPEYAHLISDINNQFDGAIVIGGMMLTRTPAEDAQKRKDYSDSMARRQMESVDQEFLRENDARMPKLSERQSKVTFGSGQ